MKLFNLTFIVFALATLCQCRDKEDYRGMTKSEVIISDEMRRIEIRDMFFNAKREEMYNERRDYQRP